MHIANYCGPLTFIEVTICGMPQRNVSFEIVLKIRCFYAKHVNVLENWPFLGYIYTVF